MEKLPSDLIRKMALDLSYEDILKLCSTSRKFRNVICNNKNFWISLLVRDYKIKPDMILQIENHREVYETILENRKYCKNIKTFDYSRPYLEDLSSYLMRNKKLEINDIIVFNYITSKLLGHGKGLPNYYQATYDRYIKKLNPLYQNKIHREENFTLGESELLTEIITRFKKLNYKEKFIVGFLNGILRGDIPYDVTLKNLCNYPIY